MRARRRRDGQQKVAAVDKILRFVESYPDLGAADLISIVESAFEQAYAQSLELDRLVVDHNDEPHQ